MDLRCLVGSHRWDGCVRERCGRTQDREHDWSKDCENCAHCGARRASRHRWNRCRCTVCEMTRADGHDWSKDCEKCAHCGQTRRGAHQFNGAECLNCGKIPNIQEEFDQLWVEATNTHKLALNEQAVLRALSPDARRYIGRSVENVEDEEMFVHRYIYERLVPRFNLEPEALAELERNFRRDWHPSWGNGWERNS